MRFVRHRPERSLRMSWRGACRIGLEFPTATSPARQFTRLDVRTRRAAVPSSTFARCCSLRGWENHGFQNASPRERRPSTSRVVRTVAYGSALAALLFLPSSNTAAQAGAVIDVPAGGSLQQALNAVQPGGTIRLAAGATYTGSFTLPAKDGTDYILITTATRTAAAGHANRSQLQAERSQQFAPPARAPPSRPPPARATTASSGWRSRPTRTAPGDIIALGHADQTTLSSIPHHIELDRVLIAGDPVVGQKRAIAANAISVTILNSHIRDIKAVGQDSQAIASWNSPGPFVIRNNYLEAAGENIMFGGAHISVPGVIPSDITVEDNLLTKNPAWKGSSWTVKNIFELKNARRVVVRRNIMHYTWGGAQTGFAIVLTPRNSSGHTPWVVVSDVEFSGNVVAHSGSAFNLLGSRRHRPERPARPRRHQE